MLASGSTKRTSGCSNSPAIDCYELCLRKEQQQQEVSSGRNRTLLAGRAEKCHTLKLCFGRPQKCPELAKAQDVEFNPIQSGPELERGSAPLEELEWRRRGRTSLGEREKESFAVNGATSASAASLLAATLDAELVSGFLVQATLGRVSESEPS